MERVRDAIEGHELIDWADTGFESLQSELDVTRLSDVSQMHDNSIYAASLPDMVRLHARRRTSHVLVTSLNENWGAFSSHIPDRTYPQGDWEARAIDAGCSPEAVRRYLDDPAVKAVVTLQHTAFEHPTILSIPIGIHNPNAIIDQLENADSAKTQDLLINNNAWRGGTRERINDRVIANFGGRLRNTYGLPVAEFHQSIVRSRFVLCPSGMGLDTHRLWETLILGSIPIVERCAGWQRVLDELPAVWVTDFAEVTPALLADAYRDIHARCDRFDYGRLTKRWWTTRIQGLVAGTNTSKATAETTVTRDDRQDSSGSHRASASSRRCVAPATPRERELPFGPGQQRALSEDCARSPVGRLLPDALYVHVSSIADLPVLLRACEGCARALLSPAPGATLVKFRRDKPRVAYLYFRDFDTDPHPQLRERVVVDLETLRTYHRDYTQSTDPPLLHRKECFVSDSYPRRAEFAALTLAEVEAGLLSDTAEIRTARAWSQRLAAAGLTLVGHELVQVRAS